MNKNDIYSIQQLKLAFKEYIKLIEEVLYPAAQANGNIDAMEHLHTAWLRLQQGPIRTLLLGVSSAGKSTLINAMTGHIVVPEGRHTTSPVPVWIYSDTQATSSPHVRLLKKNGAMKQPIVENCGSLQFIIQYCYTPQEAAQGVAQNKYKGLIAAPVNLKSEAALKSGITLVDTPGIGVSVGDNTRVDDILNGGCELIAIVFMSMNQQDEDYYRQLLVEEDAPFRDILQSKRLFAVHNIVRPGTEADAKAHIKTAFNGALPEKNLFMINALHARMTYVEKDNGVYNYPDLLPQGYSNEEWAEANKNLETEKGKRQRAKPQPELERLWCALGARAEAMVRDRAELDAILTPIHREINTAISLLEADYDRAIVAAQNRAYNAPDALLRNQKSMKEYLDKRREGVTRVKAVFGSSADSEFSKFLASETESFCRQVRIYLKGLPELRGYRLYTDTNEFTTQSLLDGIASPDWSQSVMEGIMIPRSHSMAKVLAVQFLTESYEAKSIPGLRTRLFKFYMDHQRTAEEMRLLTPEIKKELDRIIGLDRPGDGLDSGHRSGVDAVRTSNALVLHPYSDQVQKIQDYLKQKQTKINAGGMGSRLQRGFLNSNLEINQLDPFTEKEIERAVNCYADGFVTIPKNGIQKAMKLFEKKAKEAIERLEKNLRDIEDEITAEQQRQKKEAVDKLKREKRRLSEQHIWG